MCSYGTKHSYGFIFLIFVYFILIDGVDHLFQFFYDYTLSELIENISVEWQRLGGINDLHATGFAVNEIFNKEQVTDRTRTLCQRLVTS